jgi:hypothetical protein
MFLAQGSDVPNIASKAMETGGVAATILIVLCGCIVVLLWSITRFWKQALKPFFEALANVMEAHRDAVREANELAKEVRFIHEKHKHLLLQSPPMSAHPR